MATLGRRLNSTVQAYNDTVGSYEARVLPSARRFADHGAVSEEDELPELEPVTVSARSVQVAAVEDEPQPNAAPRPAALFEDSPPRRLRAAD
jgi:DNA recombination protein RmuC